MVSNMFNEIFDKIKEFDNIVIARHIGVDPDALCSSLALRDSIKLTFPENISSTVLKAILEAFSSAPLYVTPKKSKKAAFTVVMDSTVACS